MLLTFIVGGDVGETDGDLDGFNVGALVAIQPVKENKVEYKGVRLTYGIIHSVSYHINTLIGFLRASVGPSEGGEVGALVAILWY